MKTNFLKSNYPEKIYIGTVDGEKIYLSAPSWDCDWYWGFGYIETYTNNNNPNKSKDIKSHQHAENFISEWFIEWNGSKPILKEKSFNEKG